MYQEKDFLIGLLVIIPILNFLHEMGHVIMGLLVKAKTKKLVLGTGKTIIKIGVFEVKSIYFIGSMFIVEYSKPSKTAAVVLHTGGIFFNLLLAAILHKLKTIGILPDIKLVNLTIILSLLNAIIQMLPMNIFGANTDMKSIMNFFKYSFVYTSEEQDAIKWEKLDKEIDSLKAAYNKEKLEVTKIKYINLVLNKASYFSRFGMFEKSIDILKSIETDVSDLTHEIQTLYYNNLVYHLISYNQLEEAKSYYHKLLENINKLPMDSKRREYTDDTIATYEYYMENFEESQVLFENIIKEINDPNDRISSNYYLSLIYARQGMKTEAKRLLDEFDINKAEPYMKKLIIASRQDLI